MYRFKEAFLPSAFIIFVSLVTSTRCDSFIHAIEGESVKLYFPYPCNSTEVTLQYGKRLPFYDSETPDFLNLNHDESGRFTVENTNEEETCFLQLSIDPAKRLDGGTYILLAYIGDYVERIGLHVDFLPGVAHCSFGGSHDYTGDWERLHCIATVGSMLGQIQCYQGVMRMPYLSTPSENDNTLEQTILVQKNRHHVYCCSSQLIEPKERCDCHDAVWDSLSQAVVHNPGDPCPTTTYVPLTRHKHIPALTTSYHYDHSSSNMREIIPTKGENKEEEIHPTNTFLLVIMVTFAMLMTLFIIFVIYLTQSRLMRRRTNAKQPSFTNPLMLSYSSDYSVI